MGPYYTTNTDMNGEKIHKEGKINRFLFGDYKHEKTNVGGFWKVYRGGQVKRIHDENWKPTRKGTGQ